jgi:uroporphyrinogen-III decarboxylase
VHEPGVRLRSHPAAAGPLSQLDAAILFSDILTIPDAMGQGLYFETGEGPRFKKVVSTLADIEALPIPIRRKTSAT